MMYLLTPEEHAQIVDALGTALDNAQQVAHDTHEQFKGYKPDRHAAVDKDVADAEAALAMLKAMKPVTPTCYGWRGKDGAVRDCIAPDTHQIIEGQYSVPLYAKEQQ